LKISQRSLRSCCRSGIARIHFFRGRRIPYCDGPLRIVIRHCYSPLRIVVLLLGILHLNVLHLRTTNPFADPPRPGKLRGRRRSSRTLRVQVRKSNPRRKEDVVESRVRHLVRLSRRGVVVGENHGDVAARGIFSSLYFNFAGYVDLAKIIR
jgi:hypothetical protein